MITALCGGVGGSKLALGFYETLPPHELTVIVNTADDLTFCGLHVSPDLDTVCYTLAGISQRELGWGIQGDTFVALGMLERLGVATWFRVGDLDLALHVFRTERLNSGMTLTEVTREIAEALGVGAEILPMTDSRVATRLLVGNEWIDFQDYFVRRRHSARVERIVYEGVETAGVSQGVASAITEADVIVLVNSNPLLSIMPILSVGGVRDHVARSHASKIAVSPIVGDDAVSGPAGELLRLIDQPNSSLGVANVYQGLIDGLVIDETDKHMRSEIEGIGIEVLCTNTLMRTHADKVRLAREVIEFAADLR